MSGVARVTGGRLLGRNAELGLVTALLDGIDVAGGALVLCGEPGIGKSCLLGEAARMAGDRGMTVLRTPNSSRQRR